jgi:hypothetical protein
VAGAGAARRRVVPSVVPSMPASFRPFMVADLPLDRPIGGSDLPLGVAHLIFEQVHDDPNP